MLSPGLMKRNTSMRTNLMIAIVAGLALPVLGACDSPEENAREQQEELLDERTEQRGEALEREYEMREEALEQQHEQLEERIEDEGPLPPSELPPPTGELTNEPVAPMHELMEE